MNNVDDRDKTHSPKGPWWRDWDLTVLRNTWGVLMPTVALLGLGAMKSSILAANDPTLWLMFKGVVVIAFGLFLIGLIRPALRLSA